MGKPFPSPRPRHSRLASRRRAGFKGIELLERRCLLAADALSPFTAGDLAAALTGVVPGSTIATAPLKMRERLALTRAAPPSVAPRASRFFSRPIPAPPTAFSRSLRSRKS